MTSDRGQHFTADDQPMVSVIMPAYNAERYIGEAVDSVLSQTYTTWELLIVNDASSDRTMEIALGYAHNDERIKAYDLPSNQGVVAARNRALEEATGKYIAFLDSDDVWYPDKLGKQIAFMETGSVLISYTCYTRVNEDGHRLGEVIPPDSVQYSDMLKSNFIGNLTGVYNANRLGKEFFSRFGHEDYVAWLELVKRAGIARAVPEVLASYRVYSGSTSSNKLKTLGWQWKIYRASQSLGFFRSCLLMFYYIHHALYKRL